MTNPSLAAEVEMSFSKRLELEERLVDQQKIPLDDSAELANSPACFLPCTSLMATLMVMSYMHKHMREGGAMWTERSRRTLQMINPTGYTGNKPLFNSSHCAGFAFLRSSMLSIPSGHFELKIFLSM